MQEVDEQYLPKLRFGLSLTDLVVDARWEPVSGGTTRYHGTSNSVGQRGEKPVLAVDVLLVLMPALHHI